MRPIYAIFIYLSAAIGCSGAQIPEYANYYIQNYSDDNGLPQNSVREIIADPLGIIWLATEGGLVRFDGRNFKIYSKNNLGIGNNRFVRFTKILKNENLYGVSQFGAIVCIKQGEAFRDTLVNIRHVNLANINPIKKQMSKLPSLGEILAPGDNNYKILPGKQGSFYLYYNQQIIFSQSGIIKSVVPFTGSMSFDIPPMQWSHQENMASLRDQLNIYNFLVIDGRLFYHIKGVGNAFVKPGASVNAKTTERETDPINLSGDIQQNPKFKKEGKKIRIIWNSVNQQAFACLHNHLYLIRYVSGQLTTKLLIKGFDFDKNYVTSALYNASEGIIFLGSITKGLFVLTPKSFKTFSIPATDADNIFYAQTAHTFSSVVTPQGYVLSPKDSVGKLIPEVQRGSLSNKFTILKDKNQCIWICKENTVCKFSPDGKTQLGSWKIEDPTKIYQGSDDGIWIGNRSGSLFYLTESSTGSTLIKTVITIPKSEITWLHQNDSGHISIGTVKGLYQLNLKQKRLTSVTGLAGKNIRSLYEPQPDQLWITTYGSGLFLLENNKLTSLPADANGYLDYAHCIVEDQAENFWITTNKGLFQAKKKDLLDYRKGILSEVFYLYYDKNDGFRTNEFNGGCQPCGVRLEDGNISFPSLNGLVWFNPLSIKHASLGASFIFEDIDMDGTHPPLKDTMYLPYNFNHLNLSPATFYAGNTNNLHFKYSIQKRGAKTSNKWFSPDKNQTISIYTLPAGEYVLKVRKTTGFNNHFIEKQISIHIATPWFLRWWFISLAGLSLIALVFSFVRWRTQYLTRQNQQLSRHVTLRTQELSKTLHDLKISDQTLNRQLQIQNRIIGVISHDLRTPLKYLSANSKKLQHQIEQSFPDFPYLYMGKSIYESADKVYTLTDDLLKFIKTTMRKEGKISNEQVNVGQILEAKYNLFTEIARENQTKIFVETEEDLMVNTNRQMLDIIIHNLLDNAVKSAFDDTITLSTQKTDQHIYITVADTGDGMPPEIADWLNNSAEATNIGYDPGSCPPNIGLGLIVVKEMADILRIRLSVETGTMGTKIHLGIVKGDFF